MEKIVLRRTINIGNYETISFEASAEHEDLNIARILAVRKIIELAQQEMVRIFSIRVQNTTNSPWDQMVLELQGLNIELDNLNRS
jgi:hypothetical protein